jgi:hypothetical protein
VINLEPENPLVDVKNPVTNSDRSRDMKGTIKDLLKVPGVDGYVIASPKSILIKLPSKHRLAGAKDRIKTIYNDLAQPGKRPGSTVEVIWEDLVLTIFLNGAVALMVVSSHSVNLALVRMTGKLVMANILKEQHL